MSPKYGHVHGRFRSVSAGSVTCLVTPGSDVVDTIEGFPADREWCTLVPLLAELVELEWLATFPLEAVDPGLDSEREFCFDSAKEIFDSHR